ncbi:MAG: DUF1616 domain-containing protein [Dehalococcoidia bacterium]|nr:MAG: DUF1616 domain-containing protein [Dehalococcoidia bacterium]
MTAVTYLKMTKLWNKVLTITLAVLVVSAVVAVIFTFIRPAYQGYTEFYLLDSSGGVYQYPENVYAGDNVSVTITVVNQESEAADYRLAIKLGEDNVITVASLSLAPDEEWRQTVSFIPQRVAPEEKVEFLLYMNGESEPYRKLHLWLNVMKRNP